jgi:hypothetical protein
MKFNKAGITLRKWSRVIHRDLSFFFSGMVLIYAISGIVMNHRNTINPNYSVERQEYAITEILPMQSDFKKEDVLKLLVPLGEEGNYTKHYFPQENLMKVFLKGGSSLVVELSTRHAVYEKLSDLSNLDKVKDRLPQDKVKLVDSFCRLICRRTHYYHRLRYNYDKRPERIMGTGRHRISSRHYYPPSFSFFITITTKINGEHH